jgi:hypothetical protein
LPASDTAPQAACTFNMHKPINFNNPTTNANREIALSLRKQNLSFAKIGEALGVSRARAAVIVQEAERAAVFVPTWAEGLGTFLEATLINGGYTSVGDVLSCLAESPRMSYLPDLIMRSRGINDALPGIGVKRVREIGDWLFDVLSNQGCDPP